MALPSYWISQNRKDLAERAIVSKREKDAARALKCIEVDSYHRNLALKTSKYRNLEDVQGLKASRANDESSVKENLKIAERERLEYRRQKLSHILAVESDQYVKELKAMQENERDKDPWNIMKLKEQIEDLQRKRKEGEQNLFKNLAKEINKKIEFNIEQEKKFLQVKEDLLKEIDDANEKARGDFKSLDEKKQYFLNRFKRFDEELESISAAKSSRPSSSSGRNNLAFS
ncbi:uncharacterized protein NPIL_41881 [Nephila pilipes]|uniref:Uncharacterized protein n=1 Tax=Nephila pilipes TaxID=299642 RepID=A0A8X6PU30_NEPPI|nr:uncharacterized protein NPIL_41881 [Nephila pilipes]